MIIPQCKNANFLKSSFSHSPEIKDLHVYAMQIPGAYFPLLLITALDIPNIFSGF